jgi:hypothetical protein
MRANFAKYGALPAIQFIALERNPERAMRGHDAAQHNVSHQSLLWAAMTVAPLHAGPWRINTTLQRCHDSVRQTAVCEMCRCGYIENGVFCTLYISAHTLDRKSMQPSEKQASQSCGSYWVWHVSHSAQPLPMCSKLLPNLPVPVQSKSSLSYAYDAMGNFNLSISTCLLTGPQWVRHASESTHNCRRATKCSQTNKNSTHMLQPLSPTLASHHAFSLARTG